jgi:hypothetical protein
MKWAPAANKARQEVDQKYPTAHGECYSFLSKLLEEHGATAAEDAMSEIWEKIEPIAKRINRLSVQSIRGLRAKVLVALWEALPPCADEQELSLADEDAAQTLLRAAAEVAGLRSMIDSMEGRLSELENQEA